MKIDYLIDGLIIRPESELEKMHMITCVKGLKKGLCLIDDGTIRLRFDMCYEKESNGG